MEDVDIKECNIRYINFGFLNLENGNFKFDFRKKKVFLESLGLY